jgi:hypothetical protein
MRTNSLRFLLGTCGFCSLLVASTFAAGVDVTVGGTEYNVTDVSLSPGNSTDLTTLENQPFWGNESLADSLAVAVAAGLGMPNNGGSWGPLFAWGPFTLNGYPGVTGPTYIGGSEVITPNFVSDASTAYFAEATVVPSVPDALDTFNGLSIAAISMFVLRRYLRRQTAAV